MKHQIVRGALLFAVAAASVPGQQTDPDRRQPIYQVTVVERTTKAVNYNYRSGPTLIDFRGTVLLPKAKGIANVHSKQGRTEIDASLEHLTPPSQFGRQYLTYVLWAITPEGRPHNLGEMVPNTSDKARVQVTTDLQAFALIVTAEPYSAVRQPGDVVVAENSIRSDTTGKIEEVSAKYDLLPRGTYVLDKNAPVDPAVANAPKVSMREYEALSEIYQAQNAINFAQTANADKYAPNTFAKAQQLLDEARQIQRSKGERRRVVEYAREASQTAEDARVMAERRHREEQLGLAKSAASQAELARAQAEMEAERARTDAGVALAQADADRAARQKAEAEAAMLRQRAAEAEARSKSTPSVPPASVPPSQVRPGPTSRAVPAPDADAQKTQTRMHLLEDLNGVLATRDTPRGLVVTVSDLAFDGTSIKGPIAGQLARVSAILARHPSLKIEIEGHSDSAANDGLSWKRAEVVRDQLGRSLSGRSISAKGLGNARPMASNVTHEGREENQRVEIIISGDSIGTLPFWDRTYKLTRR